VLATPAVVFAAADVVVVGVPVGADVEQPTKTKLITRKIAKIAINPCDFFIMTSFF
jgi:hypothetical protein